MSDRTADQERAVGRVQLVGILVLIGLIVGVRVLDYENVLGTLMLLTLFAAGMVLLLVVSTALVACIDRRPAREVVGQGLRDICADVTKFVDRLRRR